MLLSIIITNYRNPELLRVCIDSVKKNITFSDYEIIVADTATEEDTVLMMREYFPGLRFLPFETNIGFASLVEAGFKESQGEYVLILNGDIIVKKQAIEKLLDYFQNNPTVGLVGPQLLNFNETLQYSCFRFYSPLTIIYRRTFLGKMTFARKHLDNFIMKDFDHQSIKEVDWLMGSALLTSRKAIEKVGLLDKNYKLYFEDTDWCRRFWENGYKVVYFPLAQMYHYHGRQSAGKSVIRLLLFNKYTWWHIKSALRYFRKYAGKKRPEHN